MNMDMPTPWTKADEKKLTRLVSAGGHSWNDIEREFPNHTQSSCQAHYRSMRARGVKFHNPERLPPTGLGSGSGRPKNRLASEKLSFRMDREVKTAFVELAQHRLNKRPGALLQIALKRLGAYSHTRLPKPCGTRRSHAIKSSGERMAVCWGVPSAILKTACRRTHLSSSRTAERAVVELLQAYGYTIESKT